MPQQLAVLYLATIQAIAYGTRHILDAMNQKGYRIDTILACGGSVNNPLFLKEHADITGCRIVLPKEQEAVLLGSAMLGAVASGHCTELNEAMSRMSSAGSVVQPVKGFMSDYHSEKYRIFHKMYDDQMAYRAIMKGRMDE